MSWLHTTFAVHTRLSVFSSVNPRPTRLVSPTYWHYQVTVHPHMYCNYHLVHNGQDLKEKRKSMVSCGVGETILPDFAADVTQLWQCVVFISPSGYVRGRKRGICKSLTVVAHIWDWLLCCSSKKVGRKVELRSNDGGAAHGTGIIIDTTSVGSSGWQLCTLKRLKTCRANTRNSECEIY